jgi:acyl-CoA synthetase (AMP-forming)/AMP-acid ligase II
MDDLGGVVRAAAAAFPARVAVQEADGTAVTYADLDRRANTAAAALAARGVTEGSVAALVLPSDGSYVVAYVALARLGAVTAGVSPRLATVQQDAVLDRLAPDLVVRDGDVAALEAAGAGAAPPVPLPPDPDRIVAVVFTSGTTGVPKGAVFANRQLAAIDTIDTRGATAGSGGPMLASTQFAHVGFMTKLRWYLRLGSTICLMDRWRAEDALRLVAEHRMTSIGGVAAQIGLMLRVPDFARYDVSSVRTIVVGAGPSPPALVAEARERFGAAYSIRYSSTESGGTGTATAFDAPAEEALHTVGRPRPGVEMRVDDGTGEVLLRSPTVMSGYWRDPDATARALDAEGWLHTGDLGAVDDAGCLRLHGRASDMYIRGGYNVHPLHVEAVLLDHAAVAAVVVVPRPDAVMGEIGVAVVVAAVPGAPPTLDELRAHAAGRLASYELPEALRVVESLPLTPLDKVDRHALAAAERR